MRCARFERWISLEMDGRLAESRKSELQSHLDACSRCRRAAEMMNASAQIVRPIAGLAPVGDPLTRAMMQIESTPSPHAAPFPIGRLCATLAAAAACTLVVGFALRGMVGKPSHHGSQTAAALSGDNRAGSETAPKFVTVG